VELQSGRQVHADAVLYVDRLVPDTASLNLEATGLTPDSDGRIPVDGTGRTAVPHVSNLFAAELLLRASNTGHFGNGEQ
jgi:pyruvate/2-oxoglutarate dehydrogenase complex dihydrolipoamide dehydrogenase (E3) component